MFYSKDYESAATKASHPYAVKKYCSEGKNIPLKKNWSEEWCLLPANYDLCLEELLNLNLLKDDVFVVTFMKSGTTWMQECAWLLMNNLDFDKSKRLVLMKKSPFLEHKGYVPDGPSPIEISQLLSRPRLLKSHMPAHLLPLQIWPKKQKLIYVSRNVKDIIVSSYHFLRSTNLWTGNNLSDYVEDFINNDVLFTPFWSHVLSFWFMRHESFIFFITFEEMKRDLQGVLQRLCDFLERPQLMPEELETTVDYLSFENMKKNKNTGLNDYYKEHLPGVKEDLQFMRRGIVGSFKDELTPELIAKIDNWSAAILSPYNLKEEDIFGKL